MDGNPEEDNMILDDNYNPELGNNSFIVFGIFYIYYL